MGELVKPISVRLDPDIIDQLKTEVEKRTGTSQASIITEGLKIVFSGELDYLRNRINEKDEMINFLQNQYGVKLDDAVTVSSKMEKEQSIMLTKLAQELNLPKGKVFHQMLNDPAIVQLFIQKQKIVDLPQLENIEPKNTPELN